MARRLFCADVEADNLLDNATRVWCASVTELDHQMREIESSTVTDMPSIAKIFSDPNNLLVMHNGIGYDGPVVHKLLGVEVKAEIIDTLYLSWYLYPKLLLHGLAAHGEALGIHKPTVVDWSTQHISVYTNRCEEDVRIQTALWKQMWKHLMLMYGEPSGCWHVVRHLNFKAKCAALQEECRWKLDVGAATEALRLFTDKYDVACEALSSRMPEVPTYSTRKRPKKCFNQAGGTSALGVKWRKLVEEEVDPELYFHGDPITYMEDIKIISGYKEPNAGSHIQLKSWLFSLGWEPESFKYVKNKETRKVKVIPQIKNQETEELCDSIIRLIDVEPDLEYLREMSIVKHRITVVSGFLNNVSEDGYVYAGVQGLTNTIRFKHKICCNIPSTRKAYGALIRGLLLARDDTMELCGSDLASLEDRTKQHFMYPYDPEYVKQMMAEGFDPHCDMAIAAKLMTVAESVTYKKFNKEEHSSAEFKTHTALALVRHAGKSTNYAATYGASGATIARDAGLTEDVGNLLHQAYWERNWSLNAIADACVTKHSRGMEWLWNPVARMWIYLKAKKDKFSTLNQSTGTYAFDRWVFYILEQRGQITAQFHDEVILELKKGNREAMTKILKTAMDKVNTELNLNRDLDCDVDFGDSYADVH
tara:strand:- start:358 stop:2301 length:1944 start_codon:yes stop_codon:yes gene_type:complete